MSHRDESLLPVPPSWICQTPEENEQRLSELLAQGESDDIAGRTVPAERVQQAARERIAQARRA